MAKGDTHIRNPAKLGNDVPITVDYLLLELQTDLTPCCGRITDTAIIQQGKSIAKLGVGVRRGQDGRDLG